MSEDTSDTGTATAIRILVPVDGSPEASAALPYAAALATPGTEIVLLTVFPPATDAARAGLETAAQRLRVAGQTVRTEVATGNPARRIVDMAADLRAEMIVMASHGRGAIGRLIYGSVADRVGRESAVPVMVVRTKQLAPGPVGITRLVVPLDGTSRAESALPVATTISQRLGTPISLVRVVDPLSSGQFGEETSRHGTPMRDCWVKSVQRIGSEVPRVGRLASVACVDGPGRRGVAGGAGDAGAGCWRCLRWA